MEEDAAIDLEDIDDPLIESDHVRKCIRDEETFVVWFDGEGRDEEFDAAVCRLQVPPPVARCSDAVLWVQVRWLSNRLPRDRNDCNPHAKAQWKRKVDEGESTRKWSY